MGVKEIEVYASLVSREFLTDHFHMLSDSCWQALLVYMECETDNPGDCYL